MEDRGTGFIEIGLRDEYWHFFEALKMKSILSGCKVKKTKYEVLKSLNENTK
jgi:hypothetical protein